MPYQETCILVSEDVAIAGLDDIPAAFLKSASQTTSEGTIGMLVSGGKC
jgi:hypothetical protein